MARLYIDTETVGFYGMATLIQYAYGDGPICIYEVWKEPIWKTLGLIESFMKETLVGFNLAFDHFHLCKLYTIFRLFPLDWIPEEHIDEIALREAEGMDGPCLKPHSAMDLLLHSRRGPMQSLMAREDIRIRRVPTVLAYALAQELEKLIEFDGIYFAKRAAKDAPRWNVFDRKTKDGEFDKNFKDVVLRFAPAGGLKFLAEYVLKREPKYHYKNIEPKRKPKELGYAPTALAVSSYPTWEVWHNGKLKGHSWPHMIKEHIDHWHTREDARTYASDDIVYTRDLDKHFGYPEEGDDNSVLACMVAAVRWHGFALNIEGIKELQALAKKIVDASPVNCNKPKEVRRYIGECMDDMEKMAIADSTKKANLLSVSKWEVDEPEPCSKCEGRGCTRCTGGVLGVGQHPAAKRAAELLSVKVANKEIELYKKLLRAGRLHASFKIVGTLSDRMSGADGLSAHGIKHTADVRKMFPLRWGGMKLSIGDFDSFEVTIADGVCQDPDLRSDLMKGYSIHGHFGTLLWPGMSYEDVLNTKKTEDDKYTAAKQGFFATILYGGTWETLKRKLGVCEKDGKAAIISLLGRYTKVKAWRDRVFKEFCSMSQVDGKRVIWTEPKDYCESFFGWRRYFTLENKVCKTLFQLAQKMPKAWKEYRIKVLRRDKVQFADGAVASALYGAAFAIQQASMRAAANHEIQSPGAEITKHVQRQVWELQPEGIHDWVVAPFQVHDEIATVSTEEAVPLVAAIVDREVSSYKDKVPLIGMQWKTCVDNWGDK